MTSNIDAALRTTDVFKALGDPIRWSILRQMAEVDELACGMLEETLPISKPTISYHIRVLVQVDLVSVRKEGRNFYYTLRRDVLRRLVDELWQVAPELRLVRDGRPDRQAGALRRRAVPEAHRAATEDTQCDVVVLTW
jgi:DNA-binding transcriptional ArsR family regulator